jgi:hypothetical protein
MSVIKTCRIGIGNSHNERARYIEGQVDRVVGRRICDLHIDYSEDKIILQGRSRTYHAEQLAHQAVLELTDGYPLLFNEIVVSSVVVGPGEMPDGRIPITAPASARPPLPLERTKGSTVILRRTS